MATSLENLRFTLAEGKIRNIRVRYNKAIPALLTSNAHIFT